MKDGFYFDLVACSDVRDDAAGTYLIVHHLWEITDSNPEVNDSNILEEATTRAQTLGMERTLVGLPGWQGTLENPVASLTWFFDNGFYVFEINDELM